MTIGRNGTRIHEAMNLGERLQYGRDLLSAYKHPSDEEIGRELTRTYRSELERALKGEAEELDDRVFCLVTIAYNTAFNQTNRRYQSQDRRIQASLGLRSEEIRDVFGKQAGYNRATARLFTHR